jgi:MFS family permease
LQAATATLTFVIAFGAVKAATNLFAGSLADRFGRKPVLVGGWIVALPVPLLLIWAPTWGWVVFANALLGVSQGLSWSATLIMKIDIVGRDRRGLAIGFNESAGYLGVSLAALVTGIVAARVGLRPEPFFLGIACAGLGLGASVLFVRETRAFAMSEAGAGRAEVPRARDLLLHGSFREPALAAAAQAGAVNNLNDAIAWGLFPLLFASAGLSVQAIAVLAALYPAVWGAGQLAVGALSDRLGRKRFVVTGMWVQASAFALIALGEGIVPWAAGAVLLGAGTALVYPTLIAVVGDVADPRWRASVLGVYRFWRDAGFAIGGLFGGLIADALSIRAAIAITAGITFSSGVVVAARMYETRPS